MTVTELYENGTIHFLYKKGIVPGKVLLYLQYYNTYKKYRTEYSYRQSCVFAANDHDVSIETIKRAIKGSV